MGAWKYCFPFASKALHPFAIEPEEKWNLIEEIPDEGFYLPSFCFTFFFFLFFPSGLPLLFFPKSWQGHQSYSQMAHKLHEKIQYPKKKRPKKKKKKKKKIRRSKVSNQAHSSSDPGPCLGFLHAYLSICYYYGTEPKKEIVDHINVIANHSLKSLNLFEFSHTSEENQLSLVHGSLLFDLK